MLASFAPGAYTAVVTGASGGTGIGSIEVYDLNSGADSELANISTRGLVKTVGDVMIGGFILVGSASRNLIVLALGPSLPVDGKLANPTLELVDGNGTSLAQNDNWQSDQKNEIIATGVAPIQDSESAIVTSLAPAGYTAVVRGAGGSSGIAVVAVYALN